jgi:hypothetical protein
MVKKSIKEEKLSESKPETIPFSDWAKEEAQRKGTTVAKVVEEVFKDGFLTYIEESGGIVKLDTNQLFKSQSNVNDVATYIRLRKNFAPISACVDYVKDTILGSGISVTTRVEDAKDTFKQELKEYVETFIENVYQDEFISGLFELIDVILDNALTTGVGASEIIYDLEKLISFESYIKDFKTIKSKDANGREVDVVIYDTVEPEWKDLISIKRMKIINDAHTRLKLYRDPQSWLPVYWTLDEVNPESVQQADPNLPVQLKALKTKSVINPTIKLHTWQMFWLSLNRKDFSERGESIIAPVSSTALVLERILNAVGEGIYRAGNKKYFIICGTPERPWSEPYIRNMIKELKEASEKNWSTIPVPSGFDVKEIGGQVFEATEVVTYYLKLIAKGMKVPNHVVGLPYRAGTEPSYNFQRMRNDLKKAIGRQLILRHIWCKYGKTKQKQGGKGTQTLGSPEIRFKTEGLLNEVDRLKMYVGLLNVANPISPQIKLEVEKSICNIMGWDEVRLPTQEELEKQIEETDKALKKKLEEKEEKKIEGKEGQPPQTIETTQKRLEGGVNVRKVGTQKGLARPMGGTRIPSVQESVEEESEEIEETIPKIPIEITVKTESKPQELIIKTETPLDKIMMELAEEQSELVKKQQECEDKRKQFDEEENARKKEKIQREIESIKVTIEDTKRSIEQKTVEMERIGVETEKIKMESDEIKKTHEAETEKFKTESEEIKKTHAKKRKIMEKLEEKLGKDKVGE